METRKVLIAEDETLAALSMRAYLEEKGFTVVATVTDGRQAVITALGNPPDIVLMDIALANGTNGVTAAKEIRDRLPHTRIIYITSLEDEATFKAASVTFPENFITKPYTNLQVLRAIELALNSKEQESGAAERGSTFIPAGRKGNVKLVHSQILYIKAGGDKYSKANGGGSYSAVYFENNEGSVPDTGKLEVSLSANNLVAQLGYNRILQVHRSWHINVDKITKLATDHVMLGDTLIPVSARYRPALLKMVSRLQYSNSNQAR